MKTMLFKNDVNLLQVAWALVQIGISGTFIFHGYPKLLGGWSVWEGLGSEMTLVGINFWLPFWGFMAAFAEFGGGILLLLGLFTRPAAFLLLSTMAMAVISHISKSGDFNTYAHPLKLLFVFAAFFIAGGGYYAFDRVFYYKKNEG